jgi:hypothetical protein
MGLDFGKAVRSIRSEFSHILKHPHCLKALNAIGFPWNTDDRDYIMLLESLVVYKELNGLEDGDLLVVPPTIVVPSDSPWPEHLWDEKLGSQVDLMGYAGSDPRPTYRRLEVMNSLGIKFECQSRLQSVH